MAAKVTEAAVDAARAAYAAAGDFAALLFFCISDLVSLDPMYQYSLPWWVPVGEPLRVWCPTLLAWHLPKKSCRMCLTNYGPCICGASRK